MKTEPTNGPSQAESDSLRTRVTYLEQLREGDNQLIRALAESAGIKITASDRCPGTQWEQFHDGVMTMHLRIGELNKDRDIAISAHGVVWNAVRKANSTFRWLDVANAHPECRLEVDQCKEAEKLIPRWSTDWAVVSRIELDELRARATELEKDRARLDHCFELNKGMNARETGHYYLPETRGGVDEAMRKD